MEDYLRLITSLNFPYHYSFGVGQGGIWVDSLTFSIPTKLIRERGSLRKEVWPKGKEREFREPNFLLFTYFTKRNWGWLELGGLIKGFNKRIIPSLEVVGIWRVSKEGWTFKEVPHFPLRFLFSLKFGKIRGIRLIPKKKFSRILIGQVTLTRYFQLWLGPPKRKEIFYWEFWDTTLKALKVFPQVV